MTTQQFSLLRNFLDPAGSFGGFYAWNTVLILSIKVAKLKTFG